MNLTHRKEKVAPKEQEEPKLEERLSLIAPTPSAFLKDYIHMAKTEGYYKMLAVLDNDIFNSFDEGTPVAHQARTLKLLRTTWLERLKRHTNYILQPCKRCGK